MYEEKNSRKINSLLIFTKSKEHEKFLQVVFFAWKNYIIGNKLKNKIKELDIERPARMKLERNLEEVSQDLSRNMMIKSIKSIMNPLYRELKNDFNRWKKVTTHFKKSLPSVKNLLFKFYFLKTFCYFNA